jgi:6-pyruvoyl-tetrahydropterin synthase related domain
MNDLNESYDGLSGAENPDDGPLTSVLLVGEPETSFDPVLLAPLHQDNEPEPDVPGEPGWGTRELVHSLVTAVIVLACTLFVLSQMHLEQVFTSAVPTGGDMGAHVWAPAYLRDHLLSNFKVTGWSMDWYGGLPVYRFYMLPPALLILLLDVVLPYGMAMKIVAILGVATLPVCCWAFGRLGRFAFPMPALFALAATIFLFDETFTILGGNIASTMAGEFSFSIALSIAVLALGVFARGMEDGKHRALAAFLIAMAALCHGIVVFFVAMGVVLLWLISVDAKRSKYFFATAFTALALAAFWLVPFILTSKYMTDMKYEGAPTPGGVPWNSYWRMFFPRRTVIDQLWTLGAIVGFIGAIVRRHRVGAFLGIYTLVLTALIFATKDGIPGVGLLWNVRLLPFFYLLRYMLALMGIVELVVFAQDALRSFRIAERVSSEYPDDAKGVLNGYLSPGFAARRKFTTTVATALAVSIVGLGWSGFHLGQLPGQKEIYSQSKKDWRFEILGVDIASSKNNGFVDGWANWNFTGYEGKPRYAEYREIVNTMKTLGTDPQYGCGRAMWEHLPEQDYGTPMALMLLPFWTDSCIGSSEGLFFEASASTPYHFLTAAAVSEKASNPVRGLNYENKNTELGVRYMQSLGIRYYMAWNPATVERAAARPELIEVAVSGPWHVYLVAGSDLVVPLETEPVVVNERGGDQRERWLETGASYFQHPEYWPAIPVAAGPDSWQRVDVVADVVEPHPKADVVRPVGVVETKPVAKAVVSDVRIGDESLSFSVDQPGVPIMVKVSWFPNWKVEGADGPYRVAPNMMVVVPTQNKVQLTYGPSWSDYASYLASLLGLIALLILWRKGQVHYGDGPLMPVGAGDGDLDPSTPAVPDVANEALGTAGTDQWWNDGSDFTPIQPERPLAERLLPNGDMPPPSWDELPHPPPAPPTASESASTDVTDLLGRRTDDQSDDR